MEDLTPVEKLILRQIELDLMERLRPIAKSLSKEAFVQALGEVFSSTVEKCHNENLKLGQLRFLNERLQNLAVGNPPRRARYRLDPALGPTYRRPIKI